MRQVSQPFQIVAKRSSPCGVRRSGGILVEALIASFAIGTATMLTVSMLVTVSKNRRTAERTLVATQELSNQLDRLTARPWGELTPELATQAQLSPSAAASLPNGELRIDLQSIDKPRPGKRLQGELRWQDRGNSWRPPLRMIVWVFKPGESR